MLYSHLFSCVCVSVCVCVCLSVCVPECVCACVCVSVGVCCSGLFSSLYRWWRYLALFRSISLYFALFRSISLAHMRARARSLSFFCNVLERGNIRTGWRRLIGSPKLQIIFHKRATKYRSLLRKMTCQDKGSYESSPPCRICLSPLFM